MNRAGTMEASSVAESASARINKYLSFHLGDEEYGLDILDVREIIGVMKITVVPRMPKFVKGVINLRGKVIPVIDLREKFNMLAVKATEETCIIVLEVKNTLMGILVDSVSEVIDIDVDAIEEAPDFGKNVSTDFITGIGKVKGKVVMLLDIRRVLAGNMESVIEEINY